MHLITGKQAVKFHCGIFVFDLTFTQYLRLENRINACPFYAVVSTAAATVVRSDPISARFKSKLINE